MNPLTWTREHQVALVVTCILGGVIGVLVAFIYFLITVPGAMGEAPSQTFVAFIPYPVLYWPWPLFGIAIAGLRFYLWRLLRS